MCRSILLGCLFTLSGCVIFPSTTPVAPELSGTVKDAQTGRGIPGARIASERAGYSREVYTKSDGSYVLPSITQWHYLWYIGSPGRAPAPWWTVYSRMTPYEIAAGKEGYVRQGISFVPDEERKAHWDFSLKPSAAAPKGGGMSTRKAQ